MTPTQRRALTADIFTAIYERAGSVTDGELATAAGYSRPHLTNIRNGKKKLSIGGLVGLCREYGADVVLAPLARRFECRVVSLEETTPRAGLLDLTLTIGKVVGLLQGEFIRARADGHIDEKERGLLRRLIRELRALADEFEALLAGEE